MKKIVSIFLVIICVIMITGCKPKTYTEIDYNKLHSLIEGKKDFVLVIGQTGCSACAPYKLTINKLVEKYGVDVKYIDAKKLSDLQNDYLLENFPYNATPTTIFVKKGVEKDRVIGNQKFSDIEKIFKKKGYIK